DHVEDKGRDLRGGVVELVEGLVDLFGQDVELDGDDHMDKDVILRLGFDPDVQLLDAEVDAASHRVDERDLGVQSRPGNADKPAEPLDEGGRLLLHGEEGKHG